MLDRQLAATARVPPVGPPPEALIDLRRIFGAIRRHLWLILAISAAVLLATAAAYRMAERVYYAAAEVVVDRRQDQVVEVGQQGPALPTDSPTVDTEVEVLRSPALAAAVVDRLGLARDPEFNPDLQPLSLWDRLLGKQRNPAPPAAARERAARLLVSRLDVKREGLSYAIQVGFSSTSPARAAEVANAVVDQYVAGQLSANVGTTRRSIDLLGERLEQLRRQVLAAESAVARYRSANGLFAASSTSSVTQQELAGLNAQLAEARAAEAAAAARLNTARAQLGRGGSGEALGEALGSPVVSELRAQRATVSRTVADLSGRYGPLHPERAKAERQLVDIDQQIAAEVSRIVANLETQASVAAGRTSSIAASLGRSQGALVADSNASVRLAELERNAESARALYGAFLDRFRQASAREGTEQSQSHIVARATQPRVPVSPNPSVFTLIGLIGAIALSTAAVLIAQLSRTGLETGEAVERALGYPALASIPDLATVPELRRARVRPDPARHVIDQPYSVFAESIRAIRAAVARRDGAQVLMVTSSLPAEGKTTVAVAMARVAAQSGSRVVLMDSDYRRRASTRAIAPAVTLGLADVLDGSAELDHVLVRDADTGAALLPLGPGQPPAFDRLGATAMADVIAKLRARFDLIVIDSAPVLAAAEPLLLARHADDVVYLVRWRKTPAGAAELGLRKLADAGASIAGVALTQVNLVQQMRTGFGDAAFYYGRYQSYYANA